MNPAWESIRISVCRRCIDGDNNGMCRLPEEEFCPLESYFPAITDVILESHGKHAFEIQNLLRARVCKQCSLGSEKSCPRRDTLDCALERYMPLIIERVGAMQRGWVRM